MANITLAIVPIKNSLEMHSNGHLEGKQGQFIEQILLALGLSYRLVVPKDKQFGQLVNGSWTGSVCNIISKN